MFAHCYWGSLTEVVLAATFYMNENGISVDCFYLNPLLNRLKAILTTFGGRF